MNSPQAKFGDSRSSKQNFNRSIWLLLWFVHGVPVAAQKPELGYVFPPAIHRHSETEAIVGGYDFTPDMQFFSLSEDIQIRVLGPPGKFLIPPPPYWTGPREFSSALPIPREVPVKMMASKDLSLGTHFVQVANANGVSQMARFLVTEIREITERRLRSDPQPVGEMPVGVSGRLSRIAEKDLYIIRPKHTRPITIDLWARRLGSNFNAAIHVSDSSGHVVLDEMDTEGQDLCVTFLGKANESYTVAIHDTDFRGARQFVYRAAIWHRPRILYTDPAKPKRHSKQMVRFFGYGFRENELEIESLTYNVQTPDLNEWEYQLKTPHGFSIPFRIPLTKRIIEVAQKNEPLQANRAICGRLETNAQKEFSFSAKEKEVLRIKAESQSIGGNLDLSIDVRHSDGTAVGSNDDLPATTDAGFDFTAPKDGEYIIKMSGFAKTADPSQNRYRLELATMPRDFQLKVPQVFTGTAGSKIKIPIEAVKQGGFDELIRLRVDGLANGITIEGKPKIDPGQTKSEIVLNVPAQIHVHAFPIRISGVVGDDPNQLIKPALATTSGSLISGASSTTKTDQILVALTMTAPFKVELIDKNRQRVVHRGTTYPAPFMIKRDKGFDGAIRLEMKAQQSRHRKGINGTTVEVPDGATRVFYPCFMPEGLSTSRTSRMEVIGVGLVKDPLGNQRHVTQSADARITMILEGALLKVNHRASELVVRPGEAFQIPIEISRSSKLQTVVTVDLALPQDLEGLFQYEPLRFATTDTKRTMTVQTTQHKYLCGTWPITVRAQTLEDNRWPVKSLADLEIEFETK